jgi:uncharacterized membrane protein
MSDAGQYGYQETYAAGLRNPWRIPLLLVTPPIKLLTAFLWVAPFAMLPLASPLSFLLTPFAAERFLSASETHWGTIFHYSAPLAPIVAMAAIDGLARIGSRINNAHSRRRTIASLAGVCILFSSLLPGHQPIWRLFSAKLYRFGDIEHASHEALSLIPADASVVAQTCIAPHLSHRDALFRLDAQAPDADYVVAVNERSPWPLSSFDDIRLLLAERQRRGYAVLLDRNGWIVLSRTRRP